jgi:hypothetical protein
MPLQLPQDDLDQARALQGSVFDDTWSKLRRWGASDPSGGLGANPMGGMGVGIVRNAEHPAFQLLRRIAPGAAENLERTPAIVRYTSAPGKDLFGQGMNAATVPITADTAQLIRSAGGLRQAVGLSGTDVPLSEIAEMARTPGSSIQVFPRNMMTSLGDPAANALHESAHAMRLARTGGADALPTISPAKVEAIREQANLEGIPFASHPSDPIHSALDAITRLRSRGFRIVAPTP